MLIYPKIDPILIHFTETTGVRWYGLMYVIGFLAFLILGKIRARRPNSPVTPDQVDDMMFYGAIGVIAGARVGEMLFYKFPQFIENPILLFKVWQGGMSFHGGLIGVTLAMLFLAKKWNVNLLKLGDFIVPLAPIGIGAGRMGNFINGELWGRPTDVSWGMVFRHVDNQPRHPSQLYEVLGEGLLLFLLVWTFSRKPRPTGAVLGVFLIGYSIARSTAEFFRVPDDSNFFGIEWLTEGQLLSIPMFIIGIALLYWSYNRKEQKVA